MNIRIAGVSGIIILSLFVFFSVYREISSFYSNENYPPYTKETKTLSGRAYFMDTLCIERENGFPLYQYLCLEELEREWNRKSELKFNERGKNNNQISGTLIRYLTSKGMYKDSAAVAALTKDEIILICNGNVNYKQAGLFNIRGRIYQTIWEIDRYFKYNNPNGGSVSQRLEYWKASLAIISENLFFGVGTGDMNIAFEEIYNKISSPLNTPLRRRSHNQFLSITVGFGIIGLFIFSYFLFLPWKKNIRKEFLYNVFFLIMLISLLTEDTIETQMGVTFFSFFTIFLLRSRKE